MATPSRRIRGFVDELTRMKDGFGNSGKIRNSASQFENLICHCTARKRGSLRSGSSNGSTWMAIILGSTALSARGISGNEAARAYPKPLLRQFENRYGVAVRKSHLEITARSHSKVLDAATWTGTGSPSPLRRIARAALRL